jgi:hypothetical protein
MNRLGHAQKSRLPCTTSRVTPGRTAPKLNAKACHGIDYAMLTSEVITCTRQWIPRHIYCRRSMWPSSGRPRSGCSHCTHSSPATYRYPLAKTLRPGLALIICEVSCLFIVISAYGGEHLFIAPNSGDMNIKSLPHAFFLLLPYSASRPA